MRLGAVTITIAGWILLGLSGCAAAQPTPHPQQKETPMREDLANILRTSAEPKELLKAAAELAASDDASDQEALRAALTSEDFLLRLNTAEEYRGDTRHLRLKRIMDQLAANPSPAARGTLLAMVTSPVYLQEGGRVDLLIMASAVVRPAPPELVAFWDKYCQPEDGYTPLTIQALVENGSPPALDLLARKFADPAHEDDFKQAWMRRSILPHRNETELLVTCERLLTGGLPERLRGDLVDVLFDYKPGEWYRPAVSYNPPPWSAYSAAARAQVRHLGDYALHNIALTDAQKQAVERTLHALETTAPQ